MKFAAILSSTHDKSLAGAWLAFTLALLGFACSAESRSPQVTGAEPCSHSEQVSVAPETTPFPDGRSVLSVCDDCPSLPYDPEAPDVQGPATGCQVGFSDESSSAFVLCLYGPGANTTSSLANDIELGIPSEWEFCEAHCPDADYLHHCSLTADVGGVSEVRCGYGRSC